MDLVKFSSLAVSICLFLIKQARSAPLCQDLDSQCSNYASYCPKYEHIRKQCPKTCNQCGTVSPSSTVTTMTSLRSLGAMQNTTPVSQGPTPTQRIVVTSGSLPQTQRPVAVSHVLALMQSTVVVLHDLTRAPTQNTKDALEPSYIGKDNRRVPDNENNRRVPDNEIRATASVPDFTQEKVLITLVILSSYLSSWC